MVVLFCVRDFTIDFLIKPLTEINGNAEVKTPRWHEGGLRIRRAVPRASGRLSGVRTRFRAPRATGDMDQALHGTSGGARLAPAGFMIH